MKDTKAKKENGVTLIALVVTIIVLVVLAGVSINLVIGDNGIITKAKEAKENFQVAAEEEGTMLNALFDEMNQKISGSSQNQETVQFTIKYTGDGENKNRVFTFYAYENETWREWMIRKQGSSDLNSLVQCGNTDNARYWIRGLLESLPFDSYYQELNYGDATDGAAYIGYNDGSNHIVKTSDTISSSLEYYLHVWTGW